MKYYMNGRGRPELSAASKFEILLVMAALDDALGLESEVDCRCGHDSGEHRRGTGACRGAAPDGLRCYCRRLAPWA